MYNSSQVENLKALLEAVQYQIYVNNVDPPADQESKWEAQAEMELAFCHFMPESDAAKMLREKL